MHKFREQKKFAAWYDHPLDEQNGIPIKNPFRKYRAPRDLNTRNNNGTLNTDGAQLQHVFTDEGDYRQKDQANDLLGQSPVHASSTPFTSLQEPRKADVQQEQERLPHWLPDMRTDIANAGDIASETEDSEVYYDSMRKRQGQKYDHGFAAMLERPHKAEDPSYSATASNSGVLSESRPSPVLRNGRRLVLPILLRDTKVAALPDTGSDVEAIDAKLVKKLGLNITKPSTTHQTFMMGDGATLRSIGWVSVTIKFAEGPGSWIPVRFEVFKKLVAGVQVILGNKFLDLTETLTKYRGRLQERTHGLGGIPRLMKLSAVTRRFPCYLNGSIAYAIADTGSDVNLINERFVCTHRLSPEPVLKRERHLELPGHRIVEVAGKVKLKFDTLYAATTSRSDPNTSDSCHAVMDVNTKTSVDIREDRHYQTFYVLPSMSCDVLLGEELLDSIDAFGVHGDSFIEVAAGDGDGLDLKPIKWLSATEKKYMRLYYRLTNSRSSESSKRSQNDPLSTLTTQELEAIESFMETSIEDLQIKQETNFLAALSLREAQESSRQRDWEARLSDMMTKERNATDAAMAYGLAQTIQSLRNNETQLRTGFENDKLMCKVAWYAWKARTQLS